MGWSISRLRNMKSMSERRHKSLAVTCALIVAMGVAGHSQAQLYKWTDENGKVQYTDTMPPSAIDRARKELRSDGTVKQETQRAATAEERRLAALKAVEDAKLKIIQDERDRKDKALLATYSDLADFDRVRGRALALMDTEYNTLVERETLLQRVINAPPGSAPILAPVLARPVAPPAAPVAAPTPGKPGAPAAAPPRTAPLKPTVITATEARSELPRLTDAIARKRRDREDITALYAKERVRFASLLAANDALVNGGQRKPADGVEPSQTAVPATPNRKKI